MRNSLEILSLLKIEKLSLNDSFKLAQICSSLIKENNIEANNIVVRVLNSWNNIDDQTRDIWADIIESIGFYPYLNNDFISNHFNNFSGEIRKGRHQSNSIKGKFLHEGQFDLLEILNGDKNLIVSAPTSFGKSLIIEEIIASNKYKNIVVIQPTLALLDETRRKLLKYKDDYKIIVRTSQEPSDEKGNVFLFTAERVNEYPLFPQIEFLVIDEFYKLSGIRDDERSSSLNNAFHYLLKKFNPKFYLLGPNVNKISNGFVDKYNAIFYKTDYSLVGNEVINIFENYKQDFGERKEKKLFKEKILFELLLKLKEEQTIIYCSSPSRVRYLAKAYSNFLIDKNWNKTGSDQIPLIEWIIENIEFGWSLTNYLENGIGIHDGALQKHITTSIIDYFNESKLKWLFCTSTIIEGVNTNAKNIIYFDSKKGLNTKIDFFDYSNIKGRAGRMMKHYVGVIYNFNKPPKNESVIIDIPFFEQNPIKDEVLIQLEESEIINKDTLQYKKISEISIEEKNLIKRNGVKVHGQKSIIDKLRADIINNYELIYWNKKPTYNQLYYALSLCWEFLLVEGETTNPVTLKLLVNRTFNYGINQNIKSLVLENFQYKQIKFSNIDSTTNMDDAIRETFQLMKHWFQYKVPKWLSVLNELQKFVCNERGLKAGNYLYYSNLIENDFLRENSALLLEYGIPNSAIRKLEKFIPIDISQDNVLDYIRENKLFNKSSLIQYEVLKIKENL